ncbi:MAG: hypothetical protein KAT65_06660 [Methanophagales archaeon]|nr:hypothetical protein [Methanophagales archaeon]
MNEYKIKMRDVAKVEKLQEKSYQIPILQTREEVINFLIRNKAYPYCSKTGKIFFRRLKKAEDENTHFEGIIKDGAVEKLGLQTEKDCRFLREQIKAALEIGKRFLREKTKIGRKIKSVEDVVNYYKPYLRDLKREVFKIMLLDGRNKNNHPSGEPKPSEEDIEITNRLVQACDLVGIRALDYIIIGGDGYMSFVDAGLMKEE